MHATAENCSLKNNSEKVRLLLDAMTTEEKANLFTGKDDWHLRGVERLGIPSTLRVTDCGHGVTPVADPPRNGTCFPTAIGQAATWNRDLIEETGRALGQETQALGNSVLLGPKIALHRLPVGGRNFESYSEDPVLTGKLAAALVRGVQSQGTAACIKVLACNNQQKDQEEVNVEVSERALREIYGPAFSIAIEESAPLMLMMAYNQINGKYASANRHLITDFIKGEWAYKGVVVSDWRGVHGTEAIAAGLDLEMPGPGKFLRKEDILQALENGTLTGAELDDRAERLLSLILSCMEEKQLSPAGPDTPEHGALARRVAEESIVLLKNESNTLPFNPKEVKTVAVIGPNAVQARLGGSGSASVCPPYSVSIFEGIEKRLGSDVEVVWEEGCGLLGSLAAITRRNLRSGGTPGLKAEYFKTPDLSGEAFQTDIYQQLDFSWGWATPVPDFAVHGFSIRWSGQLLPEQSGLHRIGCFSTGGGFRLFINNDCIVDAWDTPADEATGRITADAAANVKLVAGEAVNIRLEYRKQCHPAAVRLEWQEPGEEDSIGKAIALAKASDAVIVCAGISNAFEGGTMDRDNIELPGEQNRLIKAVAAVNSNTAVVLNNGTPLNMTPWIDEVPALLEAWYPGQEGGSAVARILFGDINPSGKLPDTFPVRIEDCPAWATYPGDGKTVEYTEGVFTGYRHYDAHSVTPLFPFGFGLSYSAFDYTNLRLSSNTLRIGETVDVFVDITNTGDRAGKETVQLYTGETKPRLPRPPRELKDFAKVELEPGETQTVQFTLSARDLACFDPETGEWITDPGLYEITAGPHSKNGLVQPINLLS